MPDGVESGRTPACRVVEGLPGPGSDWNVQCPRCQTAWLVARLHMTPEEVATGDSLMAEAYHEGEVNTPCR